MSGLERTFLGEEVIVCAVRRHFDACLGSRIEDSRKEDMSDSLFRISVTGVLS